MAPRPASAHQHHGVGPQGPRQVDVVGAGGQGRAGAAHALHQTDVGARRPAQLASRSARVNGGRPRASAARGGAMATRVPAVRAGTPRRGPRRWRRPGPRHRWGRRRRRRTTAPACGPATCLRRRPAGRRASAAATHVLPTPVPVPSTATTAGRRGAPLGRRRRPGGETGPAKVGARAAAEAGRPARACGRRSGDTRRRDVPGGHGGRADGGHQQALRRAARRRPPRPPPRRPSPPARWALGWPGRRRSTMARSRARGHRPRATARPAEAARAAAVSAGVEAVVNTKERARFTTRSHSVGGAGDEAAQRAERLGQGAHPQHRRRRPPATSGPSTAWASSTTSSGAVAGAHGRQVGHAAPRRRPWRTPTR